MAGAALADVVFHLDWGLGTKTLFASIALLILSVLLYLGSRAIFRGFGALEE